MAPELNELLRSLRKQSGESLRSAAGQLGVNASYLSRVERGEKAPSKRLLEMTAEHYGFDSEALALASGQVPGDVIEILQSHPELVEEIRSRYGDSG